MNVQVYLLKTMLIISLVIRTFVSTLMNQNNVNLILVIFLVFSL